MPAGGAQPSTVRPADRPDRESGLLILPDGFAEVEVPVLVDQEIVPVDLRGQPRQWVPRQDEFLVEIEVKRRLERFQAAPALQRDRRQVERGHDEDAPFRPDQAHLTSDLLLEVFFGHEAALLLRLKATGVAHRLGEQCGDVDEHRNPPSASVEAPRSYRDSAGQAVPAG